MPKPSSWSFGPFEFNATTYRLEREGRLVPLEPKAQDVLRLLLERAPAVVEKSDIFATVWKDVAVTDNALTRIVAQLRKALEDDARSPRYIETVATRGYRFVAGVSTMAPPLEDHLRVEVSSVPPPRPVSAVEVLAPPLVPHRRWALWSATLVVAALVLFAARAPVLRLATRLTFVTQMAADARGDAPAVAVLRPAQFTTGNGVDGTPAFSFDGSALAFSSDRTGTFEIYVQGLAPGSVPLALTSNGRQNLQPAWSPDGQFIAYHELVGGGIWLVPSRGGTTRRIAERGSRPSWSPDGRWVAVQTQESADLTMIGMANEPSAIALVDPRSGEARMLTHPGPEEGPHMAPQWSGDGARLYFAEAPRPYTGGLAGATTTIWSVRADGSDRRREASSDRFLPDLAVSPDGRGAWTLSRMAPGWLWVPLGGVPGGGEPRQIAVPANGRPVQPAMSRDGRMLAWTGQSATSSLWSVPVSDEDSGGEAEPLFLGRGLRVTGAAASPDGRLAYSGILQGNLPQVWTRDVHGTIRQVTVDEGEHLIPFWLDGYREVAYFATHAGVAAYHALDVSSGRERRLFTVAELPRPAGTKVHPLPNLNILPDAALSSVVMTLMRDNVPNLWVVQLHDGRPAGSAVQVTFEQAGGSFPHWSADGRQLVYQCGEGDSTHVCLVNADGTGRRQLTHEAGVHFIGGWMGTDTLLVAAQRDAVWNVIGVSLVPPVDTGGTASQAAAAGRAGEARGTHTAAAVRRFTRFTDARSYVRYPQYDPAGGRILFERAQTTGNIWRATLPR